MNDIKETELEVRQKYIDNLYFLCKDLLGYKDLVASYHYLHMCKQALEKPREKLIRLLLFPRGHFKTTVLTIAHSIQLQLQHPSWRILIVSGVLANAKSMVTSIGNHYLNNNKFRHFFPEYCPQNIKAPETKWTEGEIHIPNRYKTGGVPVMEGTFEAFGPEVTITSRHYDYIKLDDLVTRENSTTKDQMDKIKTFYKSVHPLKDNPKTPMDVIGTPWDDYDLYEDLRHDDMIETIFVPALVNNKATFPQRYGLQDLEDIKKNIGTYLFNALYMLDPISYENAIFKHEWFRYFKLINKTIIKDDDGEKIPVGNTFMSLDGAVTEGKNDYSAMMVVTTDYKKNMYILETWKKQVDPVELLNEVVRLYFKWNCKVLISQKIVIEKMLRSFLKEKMRKEHFYINLQEQGNLTTQTKEYRIKSVQLYYETGAIYHQKNQTDLEEELLRFPKAKYDDLADCLQMLPDIVFPSAKKQPSKDYAPNSLYVWKKRLNKLFDENKQFHLGYDNKQYVINENFYR